MAVDSTTLTSVAAVRLKDVVVPRMMPISSMTQHPHRPWDPMAMSTTESSKTRFPENNDRGWMLHFDANLTTTKTPGAFGWDITPSIVPATAVPSYTGKSSYLILTKYNNYAGIGTGDGVNRWRFRIPMTTMIDPITGATVMKTILTVIGPTPDPDCRNQGYPNAVHEWCINTAAIDAKNKRAIINSEDGNLYVWDFTTNNLTAQINLSRDSASPTPQHSSAPMAKSTESTHPYFSP